MRKRIVSGIEISSEASKEAALLFLALNTFGFDDENNPRGMSAARRNARQALKRDNFSRYYPCLQRTIKSYHPWVLLHAIFFKRNSKSMRKILADLKTFSREDIVRKLLVVSERTGRASAKNLFPILERELGNLMSFFGKLPREIKKIVLVPNPLDAYWRGYQLCGRNIVYIVVGPGAERNHGGLIRHELLHLFAKHISLPSSFIARPLQHLIKQGYGSSRVLREEYAVRALDIFCRSRILKENISLMLDREQRNFPKIREALAVITRKIRKGRR